MKKTDINELRTENSQYEKEILSSINNIQNKLQSLDENLNRITDIIKNIASQGKRSTVNHFLKSLENDIYALSEAYEIHNNVFESSFNKIILNISKFPDAGGSDDTKLIITELFESVKKFIPVFTRHKDIMTKYIDVYDKVGRLSSYLKKPAAKMKENIAKNISIVNNSLDYIDDKII